MIIVSALSLRDKERFREREIERDIKSLKILRLGTKYYC